MRLSKFRWLRSLFGGNKRRRPFRWVEHFRRLQLERLEDRLAPAVSANLDGNHVLNINLNADGDAAKISIVGSNIQVANGANAVVFSGPATSVSSINAQGTVTLPSTTSESVTLTGAIALTNPLSLTASNLSYLTLTGFYSDVSANDTITIDSPAAGQSEISGASGGVNFGNVTFQNTAHVTIDNNQTRSNGAADTVSFASTLAATGLQDLTIKTGAGDDIVDLDALGSTNSVAVTVDLGAGNNELIGPAAGGVWNFTAHDAGSLQIGTGTVTFSGATTITPAGPNSSGFDLGTPGDDTLTATPNETLYGLGGNDTFVFLDNFGQDTVVEPAGLGNDTLDFSAVTANLTFTINTDGSIDVADNTNPLNTVHASNVQNLIGGQG
ncbi:MAG TPA: hypothetical protein VKE98_24390, partial [Gemmataceae bacterium]|nr:hypothetical protein [Gemmataceae bacterium]